MEPAFDMAVSRALLDDVSAGRRGATVWVRRPRPAVAFGRLDALRPGFAAAAEAARTRGFEPVLRIAGGHAAAYHEGCLLLDEIAPAADPIAGMQSRFVERGERLAAVLRSLGADARVGEVPGEYCPGARSVNARGRVKLAGTAQRIVKRAFLFATVIVVERSLEIRAVLEDVYAALELDWDPATAGGVADEVPGTTVADVERALGVAAAPVDAHALEQAAALVPRHRL